MIPTASAATALAAEKSRLYSPRAGGVALATPAAPAALATQLCTPPYTSIQPPPQSRRGRPASVFPHGRAPRRSAAGHRVPAAASATDAAAAAFKSRWTVLLVELSQSRVRGFCTARALHGDARRSAAVSRCRKSRGARCWHCASGRGCVRDHVSKPTCAGRAPTAAHGPAAQRKCGPCAASPRRSCSLIHGRAGPMSARN